MIDRGRGRVTSSGTRLTEGLRRNDGQEGQRGCFSKPSVFGESAWLAAATSSTITTVQGHNKILHREGGKEGNIPAAAAQATPKEVDKARSAGGKQQTPKTHHISQRDEQPASQHTHPQAKTNTNPLHGPHHHPAPELSSGYRAMHDVGGAEEAVLTTQATPPTSRQQKRAKARDSNNRKANFVDERARKSAVTDAPSLRRVREANNQFRHLCSAKEERGWLEDVKRPADRKPQKSRHAPGSRTRAPDCQICPRFPTCLYKNAPSA